MHFRINGNMYKWQDGTAYMWREPHFDIQENVTYPSKWVRVEGNPSLHQLMAYEGPVANEHSVTLKEPHFKLVQTVSDRGLLYQLNNCGKYSSDTRAEVRSGHLWVKGLCVQMTPALKEFLWEVE